MARSMSAIEDLCRTMARLRAKDGCPWDQEQTHQSLARCLIDECSELLETIDHGDLPHMREELGDVLIQVVFHARLAEEAGAFDFEDVAREINEKLIRRHPHVFGADRLQTSAQVLVEWDRIKANERQARGVVEPPPLFKPLPPRLPALMFAEAVWKQIEKKQLPAGPAVDRAEVAALARELSEAELGRRLFELAAAARARGLDAEGALRRHADGVVRAVEAQAGNAANAANPAARAPA
jgi:XTP/dITP diphosphohydrolase/tetrapyrrole methylase family protein/MazG family protein